MILILSPINATHLSVHVKAEPLPALSDRVIVTDRGPDLPLDIRGPFALPPHVQENIRQHFATLTALPSAVERVIAAANLQPWELDDQPPEV